VIVLPNLYGDILSDVAAQISGSVGLAGSANIGDHGAMFEAIHGSAPRRAGQNVANPSGLILASVMMLIYLDQPQEATLIHNAWLKTLEDGIHTYDIYKEGTSHHKVGTKEFAQAVIQRLGQKPHRLHPVDYKSSSSIGQTHNFFSQKITRELVGVDIFIHKNCQAQVFSKELSSHFYEHFDLKLITNRGAKIYPEGQKETFCVDHWRCRFMHKTPKKTSIKDIALLMMNLSDLGFDLIKTENLYLFDGKPGFSSADI
jgi:isocitrate dehydrogenase